jgi:hypothetical protein
MRVCDLHATKPPPHPSTDAHPSPTHAHQPSPRPQTRPSCSPATPPYTPYGQSPAAQTAKGLSPTGRPSPTGLFTQPSASESTSTNDTHQNRLLPSGTSHMSVPLSRADLSSAIGARRMSSLNCRARIMRVRRRTARRRRGMMPCCGSTGEVPRGSGLFL